MAETVAFNIAAENSEFNVKIYISDWSRFSFYLSRYNIYYTGWHLIKF